MSSVNFATRPLILIMRLCGAWPESSCQIPQRIVWTTVLGVSEIFQFRYLITHFNSGNLLDVLDCFVIMMANSLLLCKLIVLWFKQRVLYEIVTTMKQDWKENTLNEYNMQIMARKSVISKRVANYAFFAYSMYVVTYASNVLLLNDNTHDSESQRKEFVLKMELPFEAIASPVYEIVNMFQTIEEYLSAVTSGMIHAFAMITIFHTGGQIEILCRDLTKLSCEDTNRVSIFKSLILKHQKIIAFSENIEDVFSLAALIQFFSNTVNICLAGFIALSSLNEPEGFSTLVRIVPFYFGSNIEAFILCFIGEYLITKSKAITEAAYRCIWYKMEPYERKLVQVLILRSQKPLTFTIGKFMNLSMETFANILKTSASYMSVLHAMY